MTKKRIKGYRGVFYRGTWSYPALVGATSRTECSEITGLSSYRLATYWSETSNAEDIRVATETPGIVLVRTEGPDGYHWAPLPPRKGPMAKGIIPKDLKAI